MNPLFVLGSQMLRNHHSGTDRRSLTECDQQINQGRAGTDRRKGVPPHIVADNDGVNSIVHLLQEIS